MTSLKQIEANRRNAQKSTGPKSEAGKQRSSRNAVRHGLTAETIIEPLEDAEDYQAFEEAVAASFDPDTAVARELILRLASLLWRLRRAASIETGLFQIGVAPAIDRELPRPDTAAQPHSNNAVVRIGQVRGAASLHQTCSPHHDAPQGPYAGRTLTEQPFDTKLLLTQQFVGLARLNGAFERITRYELALWRQVRQTLLALDGLQRRSSGRRHQHARPGWQGYYAPATERDEFDPL